MKKTAISQMKTYNVVILTPRMVQIRALNSDDARARLPISRNEVLHSMERAEERPAA